MTFINGPRITRSVVVPEHTIEVLDDDAYWVLDWQGNEDPEGSHLYARVAWPTLADAKRQHELLAREGASRRPPTKRPYRKRNRKAAPTP